MASQHHLLHVLVRLGHLREVVLRPLRGHVHALEPGQALEGGGLEAISIKIGLPGKLILSKRKGLWEIIFS